MTGHRVRASADRGWKPNSSLPTPTPGVIINHLQVLLDPAQDTSDWRCPRGVHRVEDGLPRFLDDDDGTTLQNPDIRVPGGTKREDGLQGGVEEDAEEPGREENDENTEEQEEKADDDRRHGNSVVPREAAKQGRKEKNGDTLTDRHAPGGTWLTKDKIQKVIITGIMQLGEDQDEGVHASCLHLGLRYVPNLQNEKPCLCMLCVELAIGPECHDTAQEGPEMSIPPPEEAHSDDSSSVSLDPDDQPGPSGTSGQSVPLRQPQATADLPPSGKTSTAPTQRAHASVSRTCQSAVCPPLQGTQVNPPPQQQKGPGGSGSGHTVQGTEAQGNRGTGRAAVRQGGDRPREPTLHEALSSIMGAYHRSQETMATVLARFQELQVLQEEQFMGFREELRSISSAMGTIVLALRLSAHCGTMWHHKGPLSLAWTKNRLPPPPALVDRRTRHKNRPPEPHPLQKENHPASGA
ncbi:hypothetical protein NDU88_003412 [Pleurodeles waltl]|uniref:Uncharacterized protein n=1 Tax=Pleurodeles waltl TaxID=8319 RepID=A0AAV7SGA0_PLEWA|nr:hypothetical protein NDU88_003412 [Pleurodeles waltl]